MDGTIVGFKEIHLNGAAKGAFAWQIKFAGEKTITILAFCAKDSATVCKINLGHVFQLVIFPLAENDIAVRKRFFAAKYCNAFFATKCSICHSTILVTHDTIPSQYTFWEFADVFLEGAVFIIESGAVAMRAIVVLDVTTICYLGGIVFHSIVNLDIAILVGSNLYKHVVPLFSTRAQEMQFLRNSVPRNRDWHKPMLSVKHLELRETRHFNFILVTTQ